MKEASKIRKIPLSRFSQFHDCFKGDTYQACIECRGMCEYNKIGTLLPGEKEFIAKSIGMLLPAFENKYLDRLVTPLGNVDVLKLVYGCPFLDDKFECTIKTVKVILCEIYPIVFSIDQDSVEFRLDERCPLTRNSEISTYFLDKGVACFKKLGVPLEWFKIAVQYDDYNFDYKQIEKLRKTNRTYETFSLSDIMKFRMP